MSTYVLLPWLASLRNGFILKIAFLRVEQCWKINTAVLAANAPLLYSCASCLMPVSWIKLKLVNAVILGLWSSPGESVWSKQGLQRFIEKSRVLPVTMRKVGSHNSLWGLHCSVPGSFCNVLRQIVSLLGGTVRRWFGPVSQECWRPSGTVRTLGYVNL